MTLPYEWHPRGARPKHGMLELGDLVAAEHQVWRVIDIQPRPYDLWTDEDHRSVRLYPNRKPAMVVLEPVKGGRRLHVRDGGAARSWWRVYPDEHYPICAKCLEPQPCREQTVEREAEAAAQNAERYMTPGVCPGCMEPISTRQPYATFPNIVVPAGPDVTFHAGRRACLYRAGQYEKRLVKRDPTWRRVHSCDGSISTHPDNTYTCTAGAACPGPAADHAANYQSCRCCAWPPGPRRHVPPRTAARREGTQP